VDEHSRPPTRSLRERQNQATSDAIVQAFLDLSHQAGAASISIPAVARESGVSVRTVYRYFPNKDELATAAAHFMNERALHGGSMYDSTTLSIDDNLKLLWVSLADQLPAVIAEHSTPAGREIRATRLTAARKTVQSMLPEGASAETADLLIASTSSSMFLELVDRMGYAPEVASAMAVRVARLILAHAVESAQKPANES